MHTLKILAALFARHACYLLCLAILLGTVLAAAGCGGGDDDDEADDHRPRICHEHPEACR